MIATDALPSSYKVLVDAPEDGCAEQFAWVPVAYAPTEADAIALAKAEGVLPWGEPELRFEVTGRAWFRRDPAFKSAGNHHWRNEREDIDSDYEPWLPCTKRAKTGVECWVLEVMDEYSDALREEQR